MNPILIEVLRGNAVESRHAGALAIVDASGRVHTALGDIERPIFPRSAVKLYARSTLKKCRDDQKTASTALK